MNLNGLFINNAFFDEKTLYTGEEFGYGHNKLICGNKNGSGSGSGSGYFTFSNGLCHGCGEIYDRSDGNEYGGGNGAGHIYGWNCN